jgi:hypothetical protein
MKKGKRKLTITTSMLCATLLLLSACGSTPDAAADALAQSTSVADTAGDAAGNTESDETIANPVTVDFMDGDTVLKSQQIEKGSLATAYEPEKDGSVFIDWFATPSKNHRFDFSTPIDADTQIFAGFSVYAEDTRDFFIVGSGTSDLLLTSSWGAVVNDDMKLSKTAGENVYTITCDIMSGDQFQFAINSTWHNKRGFGYVANPNDENGNPVFSGQGGGYGDVAAKGQNITAMMDGNYTFTLYTYPKDDVYDTDNANYTEDGKEVYNMGTYDTITWVRNGDPLNVVETVTTYYIKGEKITDWQDVYDETTGTTQDGTLYTLTVTLEEADTFLFTSTITAGDTVSAGSEYLRYGNLDEASAALFTPQNPDDPAMANMVSVAGGTYTFVYDSATGVLSATLAQ